MPQKALVQNYQYQTFGYGWLSHIRLNDIAFDIALRLEDEGYTTLPFPSFGGGLPRISNRHAAVAAGIAKFGWHNLAMSPEFGTRQRFVTIITTAKIEPTPLLEEEACDKCMICTEVCSGQVFSEDEVTEFTLAGQTVTMAKIPNKPKCAWYHDGMAVETFGQVPQGHSEELTWEELRAKRRAVDLLSEDQFASRLLTFTPGGHCGLCLVSCPKGTRWQNVR